MGFAMYNSTFNKWNSVDMGPKRDVIGELKKAIIAEGLHSGYHRTDARMLGFMNMEWTHHPMFRI